MKFIRISIIITSLVAAVAARATPALFGHGSLAGQTLDAELVKSVLLGKKVAIGDTRLVLVIAKAGEAQEAYLKSHVGMTTSQFQNHWRRLFMTGSGSAPKIVETEADAIKVAGETPGAVVIADTAASGGLAVLAN